MSNWEQYLRNILEQIPKDVTRQEIRGFIDSVLVHRVIEAVCPKCGNPYLARNEIEAQTWRCPVCREELRRKRREADIEHDSKIRNSKAVRYSENVIRFFNGTGSATISFGLIPSILTIEDLNKLTVMPYKEFLLTPYWKAISNYVRYRRECKCQLCGSVKSLNVHHRDYERRGQEYEHWQTDLILLCNDCHSKFHSKLEVN
jgi:DNA-directed RNA polymerase subunit M/transcription elongation factor TFIIS